MEKVTKDEIAKILKKAKLKLEKQRGKDSDKSDEDTSSE